MLNEKTNCLKCGQPMSLWMKACPACNEPAPLFGQRPIDPPGVNWINEEVEAPEPGASLAPPLRNTDNPGAPAPARPLVRGRPAAVISSGEMVPCKSCGELIPAKSYRCRFCDDYQNQADRQNASITADDPDSKLSTIEIIMAFMCGMPALILGVVWMVQGKPKGLKMVLLTLVIIGVSIFLSIASQHR